MQNVRHVWLGALAAVVIPLAAAVPVAQAGRDRVVMRDALMYKPRAFPISGDGDFLVRRLRWRSWGGKTAIAYGEALEQERPSHTNHYYRTRVTLSQRAYCANLHRTVYENISARILGPRVGVFGIRTTGRVYNCDGYWRLTS